MEERYLSDWSGTRYGTPVGLDRPGSVEELASCLRQCHGERIPVAVQGGRTGVSGGATPGDGERVLSLERMRDVVKFDRQAGVVVVEAGVVLAELQAIVEADDWSFPLDLGSRGSCQLGGNAATNAGGSRVIKYGNMRNMVLGLEAVLADGSVVGPANELVKNNAGYPLEQLLIGSEGTLAVITKLALRLVPSVRYRCNALLAMSPYAQVTEVLKHCRQHLGTALSAFEIMWPEFVDAASAAARDTRILPNQFSGRRALLVEAEGNEEQQVRAQLERVAMDLCEHGHVDDVIVSNSEKDAKSLWALREAVGEIQATIRPYAGFDLGMPAADYDKFVDNALSNLGKSGLDVKAYFFGHVGDGNLHAVIGPCVTDAQRHVVEDALYGALPARGTTVTAEHGVGRKKKAMLNRVRSDADIRVMKAIKAALDPNNILNPGRIFDL